MQAATTIPLQKVVVVDDCSQIQALVKARLKDEHVALYCASGGYEGLELCKSILPDLVLLDVDLPDLGGLDVIRLLKADPTTLHIPVIFLTGADSTESKVRGFELGAVDYVTKPFQPTELRARVRASLRTKYLMDLLSQRAMIDGLTGLWNRVYFNERLQSEISLTRRTSSPLSLVMLDVDHFKLVNDTYGHNLGDEALRTLAHVLNRRVRNCDVVCRYGGEEFAIIVPSTSALQANPLAEDLRQTVADIELNYHGCSVVKLTASFGVAELTSDDDFRSLVEKADRALYDAKRRGRNCVTIFSPSIPARPQPIEPANRPSAA